MVKSLTLKKEMIKGDYLKNKKEEWDLAFKNFLLPFGLLIAICSIAAYLNLGTIFISTLILGSLWLVMTMFSKTFVNAELTIDPKGVHIKTRNNLLTYEFDKIENIVFHKDEFDQSIRLRLIIMDINLIDGTKDKFLIRRYRWKNPMKFYHKIIEESKRYNKVIPFKYLSM